MARRSTPDRHPPTLVVARQVAVTTAEGPGRRFALWVQGCSLRCPGCCNPQMFRQSGGTRVPVASLLDQIARAARAHRLEGLTVLGGEPLEQLRPLTALCRGAAAQGLGVIVFTGYRLEQARRRPGFARLWPHVDTLVDGRYEADQPEPPAAAGGRRFIGSRNQRRCHRSDRYRDPALWTGPPRLEVHLGPAGELSAHGEPHALGDLLGALERLQNPGSVIGSRDPTQ